MYLFTTETEKCHRRHVELKQRLTLEEKYLQSTTNPNASNEQYTTSTTWFPSVDEWESLEIQEWTREVKLRPATAWSVAKINIFYHYLEQVSNEKYNSGRTRNFAYNMFHRAAINTLIQVANRSFGFNNWSTEVLNETGTIVHYQKTEFNDEREPRYDLEFSVQVKLKLADGTTVTKKGTGKGQFLTSKSAAYSNAQKQAVTDALRACFYSLVALLEDYEQKVNENYYDKV